MVDILDGLFEEALTTEAEQNSTQKFQYRELLEILLYLSTHKQPKLIFALCLLGRFVKSVPQVHWYEAKRVLRYVTGSTNHEVMIGNV